MNTQNKQTLVQEVTKSLSRSVTLNHNQTAVAEKLQCGFHMNHSQAMVSEQKSCRTWYMNHNQSVVDNLPRRGQKSISNTPSFDPIRYKNRQRQQWNQVAAGWQQWWPLFERGGQQASNRLVEMAYLQPGQRVLDIATGVGEPALTAARCVGPTGQIIATDQAREMLAIAQERAVAAKLQNITFHEVDAEVLNLAEGTFDAVLSRWGLMFMPDLPGALAQMRQLLRPGGWLATAVWDVPSQVPMLTLPMRVIRQFIDVPPPPAGVPNPFSLADVVGFENTLTQAGFVNVSHERLPLTWEFEAAQEFVQMAQATAAPILALLANHPAERQAEIWQAIEAEIVRQFGLENGRVAIPSEAICVVGQRGERMSD